MEQVEAFAQSLGVDPEQLENCLTQVEEDIITVKKTLSEYFQSTIDDLFNQCDEKGYKLKDYQKRAVLHMVRNRGLLVAFKMGSGKTLTAVVAAELCRRLAKLFGKDVRVVFVSPVSLIPNFKKEVRNIGLDVADYSFYSMDKFAADLNNGILTCKNAFVVVDEIHNFRQDFRGMFQGDATPVSSYSRGESLVGCGGLIWKLMGLSGTPAYNRPENILNLVAALKGQEPLNSHDFERMMKDPNLFREYMQCMSTFHEPSREGYPRRMDVVDIVLMTPEYSKFYDYIYQKTRKKIIPKEAQDEDEEIKNAFMVRLRQAVNAPNSADYKKFFKEDEKSIFPKVSKALSIINARPGGVLIFSEFKERGIQLFYEQLNALGYVYGEDYFVIDGDSKDRAKTISSFNNLSLEGKKPILFVTRAGGEGLDLKGIRDVIIFEGGWNAAREEQVIARAIRYLSHEHLTEEERKVVVHHLVLIDMTEQDKIKLISKDGLLNITKETPMKGIKSVDMYLKILSHKKLIYNQELIDRMKAVSIDSLGKACDVVKPAKDVGMMFNHPVQPYKNSGKWLFQNVASVLLEENYGTYWIPSTLGKFDKIKPTETEAKGYPVIADDMLLALKAVCLSMDGVHFEGFYVTINKDSFSIRVKTRGVTAQSLGIIKHKYQKDLFGIDIMFKE